MRFFTVPIAVASMHLCEKLRCFPFIKILQLLSSSLSWSLAKEVVDRDAAFLFHGIR